MVLRSVLVSLLFLYTCHAYPDMECSPPRGSPSTQSFPFDIQMTLNPQDSFSNNISVSITIRSNMGRMFRDFQVQCKAPYGPSGGGQGSWPNSNFPNQGNSNYNQFGTGNVIGSWVSMSSDARIISCQGFSDTIINANRDSKQTTNLKWVIHKGFSGQVQFIFTIIGIDDMMWENQIKTMDIQGSWGNVQPYPYPPPGQTTGPGQGPYYPGGQPWPPVQNNPWPQGSWPGAPDQNTPGPYGYPNNPYPNNQYNRYYNNAYSFMASWLSIFFSILALLFRHYF